MGALSIAVLDIGCSLILLAGFAVAVEVERHLDERSKGDAGPTFDDVRSADDPGARQYAALIRARGQVWA